MKKGRITRLERERRLKLLLEFIFIFRYATRAQLLRFAEDIIKLSNARRLIEYSLKQELIKSYQESLFRTKIYYLTKAGKNLIYEQESLIEHYRFDKRYFGVNTYPVHNILIEAYFSLSKSFDIDPRNFLCEWILRIGRKKREKLSDALVVLPSGIKLAIEVETTFKKLTYFKKLIFYYRYDIEKICRYHAVLLVADNKFCLEAVKKKLFYLTSEFCSKAFILADPETLQLSRCFYQGEARGIKEAVNLLNPQSSIEHR